MGEVGEGEGRCEAGYVGARPGNPGDETLDSSGHLTRHAPSARVCRFRGHFLQPAERTRTPGLASAAPVWQAVLVRGQLEHGVFREPLDVAFDRLNERPGFDAREHGQVRAEHDPVPTDDQYRLLDAP